MTTRSRHWLVAAAGIVSMSPAGHLQSPDRGFATFLGGSAWDRVQSVSVDSNGFVYAAGSTLSADFPTTPGAYERNHAGGSDGWVAKLTPDGRRIVWATYLGGRRRDDIYGVRVDGQGSVYVTGWTGSRDFPTTRAASRRVLAGGMDIFVSKLSADGTRLLFSTLIGGTGTDQCRGAMAIDASGRVVLTGYTDSSDYPVTRDAWQSSFQGGYGDAVVSILSADGASLEFSSYAGSPGSDFAFTGVGLHGDYVYFAGLAGASGFPITAGAYQTEFGGATGAAPWTGDAFVGRFESEGRHRLDFVTLLGGSGDEFPSLAVRATGEPVLAGSTNSPNFPTTTGAYQRTRQGTDDLFVSRFSASGESLLASTLVGLTGRGAGNYEVSGFDVDDRGVVYLAGTIYRSAAGKLPVSADALQPRSRGRGEAFVTLLSADLGTLLYSSYLGGSGNDRIRGLAFAPGGGFVVGGDTNSSDFQVTPGAAQVSLAGDTDGFVLKFSRSGGAVVGP